jgi:adenosylcobinamide-GDP ribazoletransferase
MADYAEILQSLVSDLRIGVSLATRLPVAPRAPLGDGDVARASWSLPVAGMLVGIAGSAAYWLATRLHLPPEPSVALALVATVLFTGAMHEDGLADAADALGGQTTEQRLQIMRDSRIGAFGVCAVVISFLMRWSALSEIAEVTDWRSIATALIVAHAASRAILPAFMYLVPPARSYGLSAAAGRPPGQGVAAAVALGILCLLLAFGLKVAVIALLMLALAALVLARLAVKRLGGQTGDVLGALEQVGEATLLLIASALV